MKKKNLLILSITALSTMVMGSCGTTSSGINSSSTNQTTSEETTSENSSEEITSIEETSEELSSTPVEEAYAVSIVGNEKAAISLDKNSAKAGEVVTITVGEIADDNVLVAIEVSKADSSLVDVTEEFDGTFTFTMPEYDVSVKAITRELEINSVTYNGDDNISISGETSVKEGDLVQIKVAYSEGFSLSEIGATTGGDIVKLTKISPVEYSFVMPQGAVDVDATSKIAEVNKYSNKTYRGSINYDDESAYGLQIDYQFTFGINTLTIKSADNSGQYSGVVFENAPFFYDANEQKISTFTDNKTYIFEEDSSDKLIFDGGFEYAYLPLGDSSTFSVYYARSQVYTNIDFELELSYPNVDATSPIQNSNYSFGVSVKDAYKDDYMVGSVIVIKRGDSSVEVPVTNNQDGTYTIIVPKFDVEINAESIKIIDLVGHKYNLNSYYHDSWTDETVSYTMSLDLFGNGVADFEYSSDIDSDNISAAEASYSIDSINRSISVEAGGDTFDFTFIGEDNLNQIELTSSFLGLEAVKLSDRKFQVSLVSNEHVGLDLISDSPVFEKKEKEFTLSIDEGYKFKSISAADTTGNSIELNEVIEGSDYKVVMPYSNVFITVITEEISTEDAPVLGLKYFAEVSGYTDFTDYYETCNYDVSFEFISTTEVTIVAISSSGFTNGNPDSVNKTVSYSFDFSNSIITIDDNSSNTLTYNGDGTLTCNYKLTTNIDGTRNATFNTPVVIPVSGNSYSASEDGYNDNMGESPYKCTFDFISDTQVHITLAISDWETGDYVDKVVSYTYDSSTKTITINGNSSNTLSINDNGSLICHYKVGSYVDFTNSVFSLHA